MTSATEAGTAPGSAPAEGMVWIPGGTFLMGSSFKDYPEEHPIHPVAVDGFWMDAHTVTVEQFRAFVEATGYVTVAERPLDPAIYPDLDPKLLVAGSLVFHRTRGPVDMMNMWNWWTYVPGADWAHPEGPKSDVRRRGHHPVVHLAWEDVAAHAAWAGKEIPSEAEWEFAARGGLEGATYTWGNDFAPAGKQMANTWQGAFPVTNTKDDGFEGIAPVASFPANGYGLHDMAGNVWEWTADFYTPRHPDEDHAACCVPVNPRVMSPNRSYDPGDPGAQHIPRHVIKGGSHLCAPSYCWRYRPAARQAQMVETSMAHIGFRCIVRPQRRAPSA